jgi:hypothetical protein
MHILNKKVTAQGFSLSLEKSWSYFSRTFELTKTMLGVFEERPNHERYLIHMDVMLNQCLPQLFRTIPTASEIEYSNFYKLFLDLDYAEAKKELSEIQRLTKENLHLILTVLIMHDLGKTIQDQNHSEESVTIFDKLIKLNPFRDTLFFENIVSKLSPKELNTARLLIQYHDSGAINLDGNIGVLEKFEEEIATHGLNAEKVFALLNVVVSFDRAAVAKKDSRDGFLSGFDYMSYKSILTRLRKKQPVFSDIADISYWIARQAVMLCKNKKEVFTKIEPRFRRFLSDIFTQKELHTLIGIIEKASIKIKQYWYINEYIFYYARYELDAQHLENYPSVFAEFLKGNYTDQELARYALMKIATALTYEKEASTMVTLAQINTLPFPEAAIAFNVSLLELEALIREIIKTGSTDKKILK